MDPLLSAPAGVHLRTRSAQVSASLSRVNRTQRLRASAQVVALTAAMALLVLPGIPAWLTAASVAVFLVAAAKLVGHNNTTITVHVTPHLLCVDGVGELPLAAVRDVRREADGRVWVRTAAQSLTLPRPLVEEDAAWLCRWLVDAAAGARARLCSGEDPDSCAPPLALEVLRGRRRG